MSVSILTGYTGERHITPYMDATFNRGVLGEDDCILAAGSQMEASMPDINTFSIADGAFSIQGHVGITNGETLTVTTCSSGYYRIDLVCARFTHNAETLIDAMEIVLIAGTETSSSNPTTPTYNTGTIASGATTVDMPLYKITLNGSDVSFTRIANLKSPLLIDQSYSFDVGMITGSTSTTGFRAKRTDTGVGALMGVSTDGTTHGVWSDAMNKWIISADDSGVVRLPNTDIRLAGHSSGIGTVVEAYASKTISNTNIDSPTLGASVSLPAGTWLVWGQWTFNTGVSSGSRNLACTIGTSSSAIAQQRVYAAAANWACLQCTAIVTPTSTTRYYVKGSSSMKYTTAAGTRISAVRIL